MALDIALVTVFPGMFDAIVGYGINRRAFLEGRVRITYWNPIDFSSDRRRSIDDRPYGGGPGMVMMFAPLRAAIRGAVSALGDGSRVVAMTPQGPRLDQGSVARLARCSRLVIVAGRYEGMDERIVESAVDEECSVGDYVLSGGELAAMVLIDAMIRLLPGSLGDQESNRQDSFCSGLLDYPSYTRPEVVDDRRVPAVLLSGDHEAINVWRLKQGLGRTWMRRPDLLRQRRLTAVEQALLQEYAKDQGATGGGAS